MAATPPKPAAALAQLLPAARALIKRHPKSSALAAGGTVLTGLALTPDVLWSLGARIRAAAGWADTVGVWLQTWKQLVDAAGPPLG